MKRYIDPDKSLWQELTARVMVDDAVIEGRVASILERVRKDGDKALIDLASEIDKVDLSAGIEVSQAEIAEAVALVSDELKASVEAAYANIHK